MHPIRKGYLLLRYFGPRIITMRAGSYARKRFGVTRRAFEGMRWQDVRLNEILDDGIPHDRIEYAQYKKALLPAFLFPMGKPPRLPQRLQTTFDQADPSLAERIKLIRDRRCVYCFKQPGRDTVNWSSNGLTGERADGTKNWFELGAFHPGQGDVRTMWEPGRAAWAIDLARAQARGLAPDATVLFWQWLDDFMEACPPWRGVHWMSGQESAVRMIAVAIAFQTFGQERVSTPKRWSQLLRLAWATGKRIDHHIAYAVSQKNNHAISEAVGLMLIAHLFPELADASRWARRGRTILMQEVLRQVYADGTYVQHSMNYHRVMLQGAMLGLRLAELARDPFPREVYDKLAGGAEFLFQMMDPKTGRLPNYGNNDGALVLPLSDCDFTDYRPTVQAISYLCHRRRLLPSGPWDEEMLWLFGPESVMTEEVRPRQPVSAAFPVGGYYTLRQGESWAMIRCQTNLDRVTQCDAMHVDLWWRGQNILQDCGTYRYFVPGRPDIEDYFKGPSAHNTIEIDGEPALESVSRFLFLPWTRATIIDRNVDGPGATWLTGELYDYDRRPWKVLHRRTLIALSPDVWVVVDDLLGKHVRDVVARWHMFDAPYKIDASGEVVHLVTPHGDVYLGVTLPGGKPNRFEVIRGRNMPGSFQGFASRYYTECRPIPTVEAEYNGPLQARMVTYLGLGCPINVTRPSDEYDEQVWTFATPQHAHQLTLAGPFRPIKRVVLDHTVIAARGASRTSQTLRGTS